MRTGEKRAESRRRMFATSATIGQRIREHREALELSQNQLAERAGMSSNGRISEYEQGRRIPSLGTIQRLAAALETTVDELLE